MYSRLKFNILASNEHNFCYCDIASAAATAVSERKLNALIFRNSFHCVLVATAITIVVQHMNTLILVETKVFS